MQKTTFIYALCEPGTRTVRYIGKTVNLKQRLQGHVSYSSTLSSHLGCWLRSLCGAKPNLIVLSEVPYDSWSEEETRYIRAARALGMDLVNANDGGKGGHNPTPETCAKISASKLGDKNCNFGKPRSAAERAHLSELNSGEENPFYGRTHSPETCAKISAKQMGEDNHNFGKPISAALRVANQKAQTGLKHSDARRAKNSEARKGVPLPESTKASMRAAWARRKERDQEIEWALAPYTSE